MARGAFPRLRGALVALSILEFAVAFRDLGRHTDAPAVFAGALAFIWLTIVLAALCSRRRLGLTRAVLAACLILGGLRAVVSLWGAPVGWTVAESIEARGNVAASYTHIEDLDFDAGDVPAHLINDTLKFNYYREDDPVRTELPLVLEAKGFVAGQGTLVITSSSPIRLEVGGEVTDLQPPIVGYKRGISALNEQPIEITLAPTEVQKAALEVDTEGVTVFAQPTSGSTMAVRRWLGQASTVTDPLTVVLSLLLLVRAALLRLGMVRRQRLICLGLVGLGLLLSMGPHLVEWVSQHDRLMVLSGGDDWLTYESYARDIRENSPLMLLGKPLGQAAAFYYQPLYPYVLAIGHLLVGESIQGIVLMQLVSAALVVFLAFLAIPEGTLGVVALMVVLLGTGILDEWMLMSERLLSENLLMILFAALLYVVSKVKSVPGLASMVLVGVLLGIAGLARSTAWVAAPFVLLLVLRGAPKQDMVRWAVVLVVPIVMLAALVPARNAIAAGNPAVMPTSGSINLYIGNVPIGRKLVGEPWIGLSKTYDPRLVAVVEAVVDAPDQVAKKLLDKTIYVLGFPRSMDADNPVVFWPILSLWILAPLGFLTGRHSRLAWVSLMLAITHVISLVIFFPNNYYYRLEMPATLPLAVWDSIAVASLLEGLPEPSWAGRQIVRILGRLRPAGSASGS